MHGDVSRFRIALETVENLESIHARHVDVERYRIRTNLARGPETCFAIELDDALVSLVAGHVEKNLGKVLIVLDDQHRAVAFLDVLSVVRDDRLRYGPSLRQILQRVTSRLAPLVSARVCVTRGRSHGLRDSSLGSSNLRSSTLRHEVARVGRRLAIWLVLARGEARGKEQSERAPHVRALDADLAAE